MNEDRYEIRSKIGRGAAGTTYSAFDREQNRDVAIKRILPERGDDIPEKAARILLESAASLRAADHPNLVTIYDVGVDHDGPFVVMELLSGSSIGDMVSRGPLTFDDFHEVAVQSQEALAAAQDLDLGHLDIKPGNVMITWPLTGGFQVKLMEFALAEFSPQITPETAREGEPLFESLFFQAPEQFEQGALDDRSDMYSMGCVYYFCLSGQYPFDGDTAPQVLESHLRGTVTPLGELRPDLPEWLSKWVMWQLSRKKENRPPDAREALRVFRLGEKGPSEYQESVIPETPAETIPVDEPRTIEPAPAPDYGSLETSSKTPASVPVLRVNAPEQTAPPVLTPGRAKPVLTIPAQATGGTIPPAPTPGIGTPSGTPPSVVPAKKKGMSNAVKGVIASILVVVTIIAILVGVGLKRESDRNAELTKIGAYFKENNPTEVPLNKDQVELLLETLTTIGETKENERPTLFQALTIGRSTDGTDIDVEIAKVAREKPMDSGIRQKLFQVLGFRGSDSALKDLIAFASETKDSDSGRAALKATLKMASRDNFESLLGIINANPDSAIRSSAVDTLTAVVKRAGDPRVFGPIVIRNYQNTADPGVRAALLRLAGASGGEETAGLVQSALEGDDSKKKVAAIYALRNWPNPTQFQTLLDYTARERETTLRKVAFESLVGFLDEGPGIKEDELPTLWEKVAGVSSGTIEQIQIVDAMARRDTPWADALIDNFIENGDSDKVVTRAERAKEFLETKRKSSDDSE